MAIDLNKGIFEQLVRAYEAGEIELISAKEQMPVMPTGIETPPADYRVYYVVMFGERKESTND